MIKKIKVENKYRSIPENFELDISNFVAITGKNSSGKTNFIRAIEDEKNRYVKFYDSSGVDITDKVDVVYIPAEQVVGDERFKVGKTSHLVTAVKKLIDTDPAFVLSSEGQDDKGKLENIFESTNTKIDKMFDDGETIKSLDHVIKEGLSFSDVADLIFEKIVPVDRFTETKHKKFDELGQGWQRLLITTFILSVSEQLENERIKLVLFEEPEVYQHPEFKKMLNKMLQEIASKDNYQVIITTHDPYFAYTNLDNEIDGEKSIIYSFYRDDGGVTNKHISDKVFGIEDELLHIHLYNKVLQKAKSKGIAVSKSDDVDKYLKTIDPCTKNYCWSSGNNEDLAISLTLRHIINHPDNTYTISGINKIEDGDLEKSIEILSKALV